MSNLIVTFVKTKNDESHKKDNGDYPMGNQRYCVCFCTLIIDKWFYLFRWGFCCSRHKSIALVIDHNLTRSHDIHDCKFVYHK